mmetsp:Transcript_2340/g.10683  ORF Transcript_2340/g.10683 Transcript_2340/m.10683 type:complete len:238 (-) Transcript_2340:1709-2422(-)
MGQDRPRRGQGRARLPRAQRRQRTKEPPGGGQVRGARHRRAQVHGNMRRRRGYAQGPARGRDAGGGDARHQDPPRRTVRRRQVPDREEEDFTRVSPREDPSPHQDQHHRRHRAHPKRALLRHALLLQQERLPLRPHSAHHPVGLRGRRRDVPGDHPPRRRRRGGGGGRIRAHRRGRRGDEGQGDAGRRCRQAAQGCWRQIRRQARRGRHAQVEAGARRGGDGVAEGWRTLQRREGQD